MASNQSLDESVDFDFFETPRSPVKDLNDTFVKDSKPNEGSSSVISKPPVQPKSITSFSSHSDSKTTAKKENDVLSESNSDSSSSDSESISSESASKDLDESRNSVSSKSSVSVSSRSTTSSLSSDKDISEVSKKKVQNSKKGKKDYSSYSSESFDDSDQPSKLTAKTGKQNKSKSRNSDQDSSQNSEDEKHKKSSPKSKPDYDDGYSTRGRTTKKVQKSKSQAWDEEKNEAKWHAEERPKTAKGRVRIPTDNKIPNKSDSETLSDSDMTDVSPMESPRHDKDRKSVKLRENEMRTKGDGDGRYGKRQFVPVTDIDYDPDRLGNLDLSILMKAVGELEKQQRLKTNTRRVMFAPMSVNRSERGNYTFDDNQTREIERENNRLLKEIVRQVNTREHSRSCARTITTQKLTPSAVNRERDIRRIEMENLAILKRLKKVKPTKSISRENQLREYETTMLHGIPIAALHPISRPGKRSAYDDSASSMTSFTSGVSSVRSLSSRLSSRPGSAVRRPTSAKRYVNDRPDWSDRW
ncbi:cilia- and flagella-associated protein 97 [Biomphalaria glabrata]|uniref:Cilia- and flagella-associated protein 97-like n=1 Tax=Biomphalaria glabrata TaxID=6526 RepID=A0A9U8E2E8_BIOGL|nr:cilia- and flagella-associated protein 97-like [Biomphalaria glabrata]XP_013069908.2 cilia- and flagella-associated protein 97-like [Biomphalaria glabrata]KAI8734077.1 cilia- and flagella-associated protein 97-like [Biomphalaria glabrata]